MSLGKFLKDYGTLIIAIYGVVQLWGVALYKRYMQKGRVEIAETGSIEIGFTAFGPLVGLTGTIFAVGKEILVEEITLEVTRVKDNLTHLFTWGALRPTKLFQNPLDTAGLDLPSSFLLTTSQPWRFNVAFLDTDTQEEMKAIMMPCVRETQTIATQVLHTNKISSCPTDEDVTRFQETYDTSPVVTDAFTRIGRLMYWNPGLYRLKMEIKTRLPNRQFTKHWSFAISTQDHEQLKLNAVSLIGIPRDSYTGKQAPMFSSAYVKYLDADIDGA